MDISILRKNAENIIKINKIKAENTADVNLKNLLLNKTAKENYATIKNQIVEIASLKNQNKDYSSNLAKYKTAKENLHKIMKELNYTKEMLVPNYKCKKCNDTGIIKGKVCECFKKELSKLLLLHCGLTGDSLPNFKDIDFSIFTNTEQKNRTMQIYNIFEDYVSKYPNVKKNGILLVGKTGTGKTHLLKCLISKAVELGIYGIFTTAFNLNRDMLAYHCAPEKEKDNLIESYLTCEMLIIDDLGSENILKNVTIEYLYLILNERIVNGLSTIISTNYSLTEIQDVYGDRIASRLQDKNNFIIIEMTGEDIRRKI